MTFRQYFDVKLSTLNAYITGLYIYKKKTPKTHILQKKKSE